MGSSHESLVGGSVKSNSDNSGSHHDSEGANIPSVMRWELIKCSRRVFTVYYNYNYILLITILLVTIYIESVYICIYIQREREREFKCSHSQVNVSPWSHRLPTKSLVLMLGYGVPLFGLLVKEGQENLTHKSNTCVLIRVYIAEHRHYD